MNAPASSDNGLLAMISGISAFITITSIQPYLTFAASIIAIVSGLYSLRYLIFKKKK